MSAAELADIAERLARGVASMPFRIGDSGPEHHRQRRGRARRRQPGGARLAQCRDGAVRAKAAGAGQVEMFSASDESAEGGQVEMLGAGTGTGEPEQASAEAAASQQSGAA